MTNTNTAARFNGKHKACGARFSVLITATAYDHTERNARTKFAAADGRAFESVCFGWDPSSLVFACACGGRGIARKVEGRVVADKKCDGRCLAATGHSCECACGGKNHGAGHSTEEVR